MILSQTLVKIYNIKICALLGQNLSRIKQKNVTNKNLCIAHTNLGGSYKDASVAAQNDCFGTQLGVLRQPLRSAAAAAAIDEKRRRNRKQYFLILVIAAFSIAAITYKFGLN